MKVVPHVDLERSDAFMDVMTDETIWADLRELAIEGLGNHEVESEGFQRLDFLFEGIE